VTFLTLIFIEFADVDEFLIFKILYGYGFDRSVIYRRANIITQMLMTIKVLKNKGLYFSRRKKLIMIDSGGTKQIAGSQKFGVKKSRYVLNPVV